MTLNISAAHVENLCKTLIISVVHQSRMGVLMQRLARLTYNKVRFILRGFHVSFLSILLLVLLESSH